MCAPAGAHREEVSGKNVLLQFCDTIFRRMDMFKTKYGAV